MRCLNSKPIKHMLAIIETEGARVLALRNQTNHYRVDYTFNGDEVFTQTLSKSGAKTPSHRVTMNFRAAIRRTAPTKEA